MHDTLTSRHQAQRRESRVGGGTAGDIDVEMLLSGAEKLCGVYEMPGALGRIQSLRGKWAALGATLEYYEGKVTDQTEALEAMNREWREGDGEYGDEDAETEEGGGNIRTVEELRAEEEEVRELEGRKRELEASLRALQKDIGGLMDM
jgi:chromosome segregation ATPase